MLNYGIPSGIQGLLFSVSNVIIQSAVNSFHDVAVVGGSSASSSIEGFMYTAMNAVAVTALNFAGQNYGARQYKRVDKVLINACIMSTVVGVSMGIAVLIFHEPLLRIYQPHDAQAVAFGWIRMQLVASTYFICGLHEVLVNTLRGIGSSWPPTLITVVSVGLVRIVWIFTVFKAYHTLLALFISWPLTWIVSVVLSTIIYATTKKKHFAINEAQYANKAPQEA